MPTTAVCTQTPSFDKWAHRFEYITSPSAAASVTGASPYNFRIHYVDVPAYANHTDSTGQERKAKGTILLIHGFPQTWYQFRYVIDPFSNAGYRVIVPDYRGAGNSQCPPSNAGFAGGKGGGYTKKVIADDLHTLVRDHLGIKEKIHVVGNDIGGMIAHAYAAFFPDDTATVAWGECPLPGSKFYEDSKHSPVLWHFTFHNTEDDIPEKLVEGKERIYLRHFYDRLCYDPWAIPPGGDAENAYVMAYSRAGAMRAAFDTYRSFEDGKENLSQVNKLGKCKVPALGIAGDHSFTIKRIKEQVSEFYEKVEIAEIKNSGHWVVEENPEDCVEKILGWIEKQ